MFLHLKVGFRCAVSSRVNYSECVDFLIWVVEFPNNFNICLLFPELCYYLAGSAALNRSHLPDVSHV